MDATATNQCPTPTDVSITRLADICTDMMAKIQDIKTAFNRVGDSHWSCLEEGQRTRDVLCRFAPAWTVFPSDATLSYLAETVLRRMGHELEEANKRADMLEKERDAANQELSETRQALGGFLGPDYRISEEVKKVVSIRDMLAARANEAEQKMMLAVSDLGAMTAERDTLAARVKELEAHLAPYPSHLPERPTLGLFTEGIPGAVSGTAVNPSKPGLQPMKCPCGGTIEFGDMRVGVCGKCGHEARALEQPTNGESPCRDQLTVNAIGLSKDFSEAHRVSLTLEFGEANRPPREVVLKDGHAIFRPTDTCDQSLTAALVEANRNTAKWRKRAQECQKALRSLRAMTGNMLFDLDEDWGNDE